MTKNMHILYNVYCCIQSYTCWQYACTTIV